MPKNSKTDSRSNQQLRSRIASAAARLIAEDGARDYSLAKRKAARQLGMGNLRVLPDNDEIEEALRVHQSLYQGDEQPERLRYLREEALKAMQLLAGFRPYLRGSVLKGTAGRYSSTLTIALPMPISAEPEMRPAQIGSMPSTQNR